MVGNPVDQAPTSSSEANRRFSPIGRHTRPPTNEAFALQPITQPSRRRAMNVERHGEVADGHRDPPRQNNKGAELRQSDVVHTSERARRDADQHTRGNE